MAASPHALDAELDEAEAWTRLRQDGDTQARIALFDRHADLAIRMARRAYRRRSLGDLELADLIQQAQGALLETIDRFDPSRGVPFPAFAVRRITGSLSDVIAQTSDVRAQYSGRAAARRDRIASLASAPSPGQSAAEAVESLADLAMSLALGFMLEDHSASSALTDGATIGFDGYRSAAWRELQGRLTEELQALPDRERTLLSHHYLRGVAFETLATMFGLSKGRVSQLHHAALSTLRKRLAHRGHFSLQR